MGLLREAADLNNLQVVQILALNQTSRQWQPSGRTVRAQVQDLGGRETVALSKPVDTEMRKLFVDFTPDGSRPVTNKERLSFGENDGRGWSVLSVQDIHERGSEGCIVTVERTT